MDGELEHGEKGEVCIIYPSANNNTRDSINSSLINNSPGPGGGKRACDRYYIYTEGLSG